MRGYEASLASLPESSDLLIWPEAAIPAYRNQMERWLTRAEATLEERNAALITGIPLRDRDARYNGIIGLGRASGDYRKQKLVPFGEYAPLEAVLRGRIDFFDLPMSHMAPGEAGQTALAFDDLEIAPFICYEIVYPDFVAAGTRQSHLIATISNDSWFGRSIGPLQHLQMARFRALETGRPVLRGTNNGVTAIISSKGVILDQLPQFEVGTLQGRVTPRSGDTPYMRLQSYPILALIALSLFCARWRRD